ncbi:unnamed protein product [Angiostrongylus costaricensis]|uniref:Metallothionein-2 n=1 Tax=Angiostrongylus costaricensis TaxID=334426 RepID=A0A0R3PAC1_ANGCS|nr:unnamed protein product [Angiostrongylus costaricensis]
MAVPISPARCVSQHVDDAEGDDLEAIAKHNDRTSRKCNTFALRNNIDMSQLGRTHAKCGCVDGCKCCEGGECEKGCKCCSKGCGCGPDCKCGTSKCCGSESGQKCCDEGKKCGEMGKKCCEGKPCCK